MTNTGRLTAPQAARRDRTPPSRLTIGVLGMIAARALLIHLTTIPRTSHKTLVALVMTVVPSVISKTAVALFAHGLVTATGTHPRRFLSRSVNPLTHLLNATSAVAIITALTVLSLSVRSRVSPCLLQKKLMPTLTVTRIPRRLMTVTCPTILILRTPITSVASALPITTRCTLREASHPLTIFIDGPDLVRRLPPDVLTLSHHQVSAQFFPMIIATPAYI